MFLELIFFNEALQTLGGKKTEETLVLCKL